MTMSSIPSRVQIIRTFIKIAYLSVCLSVCLSETVKNNKNNNVRHSEEATYTILYVEFESAIQNTQFFQPERKICGNRGYKFHLLPLSIPYFQFCFIIATNAVARFTCSLDTLKLQGSSTFWQGFRPQFHWGNAKKKEIS